MKKDLKCQPFLDSSKEPFQKLDFLLYFVKFLFGEITISNKWDQIGLFLKRLANQLSYQSGQNISKVLSNFENGTFLVKTVLATLLAIVEKLGYFLFQHLGPNP